MPANPALIPPTLPADFCNLSPQEQANVLIGGTTIQTGTSFTNLLIQAATPGVNQRAFLWQKLIGSDLVPERIYKYARGNWISFNAAFPALNSERIWWTGTESALWAYDGGDGTDPNSPGNAPTATTGAMWEADHDYDGRVAVGAGNVPGTDPVLTLAPGDTGGEGEVTLTVDQMPEHTHDLILNADTPPPDVELCLATQSDGSQQTTVTTEPAGESEPHTNMQPYKAGFWAKRTARTHYVSAP